jgi:hypothetical protein
MESAYIQCQVEPGMFKGEYLVQLTAADPRQPNKPLIVKLFADERDVKRIRGTPEPQRHKPVRAWLRVTVANTREGFVEVVFPQPAQPVGESAFFEKDLVEAI